MFNSINASSTVDKNKSFKVLSQGSYIENPELAQAGVGVAQIRLQPWQLSRTPHFPALACDKYLNVYLAGISRQDYIPECTLKRWSPCRLLVPDIAVVQLVQ
jgi:hypothetical protein